MMSLTIKGIRFDFDFFIGLNLSYNYYSRIRKINYYLYINIMLKKIASKFFEFANKLTNFIPIQSSPSLSKYIMSKDEAMRILNIKNDSELKLQKIKEQTEKYIKMNDPKKGGSFYIQNKVYYAKLALIPLCKETINNKMNGINDKIKKEKNKLNNKI